MKTRYDTVILGGGHNSLVAAAYLAGAGQRVLLLEKNDRLGGATTSQRIFPDYDASISRYAYLVSLLPRKIIRDLGLRLELRRRAFVSFTPYQRDGRHSGLLLSNETGKISRDSMRAHTGGDAEFAAMKKFYSLARDFAAAVWDTMLQPLPSREAIRRRVRAETWRALVAEPLGCALEQYLQNDLVRGLVFTDAKIGVFTHPHDESLLQNRCFLYHVLGNRTGEWRVPVGGMGRLADELERAARARGAELLTRATVTALHLGKNRSVEFSHDGQPRAVDARFVLVGFGANVLARLLGKPYRPGAAHEGSVFKINMLLRRLPRLKAKKIPASVAFCGTFHCHEGYRQMQESYRAAARGRMPEPMPCEVYCHTLTDRSVLAPELRADGVHTLTLFGLDAPWRLFACEKEAMRGRAEKKYLDSLNDWLAEPIEDCLARDCRGRLCIESKSPWDIEKELGHYRGNIFHRALAFPFAETAAEVGSWGVETDLEDIFFCGSSARRGGTVSGIPGHNAARKVLSKALAADRAQG